MGDDHGRRVVVTGAAGQGLGVAITRLLAERGYEVFGTFEPDDAERAAELAASLPRVALHPANHADRRHLAAALERLPPGRLDALVSAQSAFVLEPSGAVDFAAWDQVLTVNLSTPAFLYHSLRDRLAPGSSYVVVSSSEALRGSYAASAYAAAKAGLHNLVMSIANVGGPSGIRANVVAPGWIGGVMDDDAGFSPALELTPLRRLGSPTEVAEVVAFLLSDAASYVSGSVVLVDGGYSGSDPVARHEYEASLAEINPRPVIEE